MPETSISNRRIYFLDGESEIKSLAPDGTVESIMNIQAPPNSQVMFAVSPDDRRIAVSVITLATSQLAASFTNVMYVEDLGTAAHRVGIWSSTTRGEWPVGWHTGHLVVGVGSSDLFNFDNPYGVIGYHIVDPATGIRLAAMDCSEGLLVVAGTACVAGGCTTTSTCTPATLSRQAWDGTKTNFSLPAGPAQRIFVAWNYTELSPAGDRVAAELMTDVGNGSAGSGSTETAVLENGSVLFTTQIGGPQGWLDEDHLVVSNASQVSIVDVTTGAAVPMVGLKSIPQQGMPTLAGILPQTLG